MLPVDFLHKGMLLIQIPVDLKAKQSMDLGFPWISVQNNMRRSMIFDMPNSYPRDLFFGIHQYVWCLIQILQTFAHFYRTLIQFRLKRCGTYHFLASDSITNQKCSPNESTKPRLKGCCQKEETQCSIKKYKDKKQLARFLLNEYCKEIVLNNSLHPVQD